MSAAASGRDELRGCAGGAFAVDAGGRDGEAGAANGESGPVAAQGAGEGMMGDDYKYKGADKWFSPHEFEASPVLDILVCVKCFGTGWRSIAYSSGVERCDCGAGEEMRI